ncbi:MAG: TIGR03915 family putative DNA repair protein [Christensenellales bacterium]
MHGVFDGSFDGLLSLTFDTWRLREALEEVSVYTGADSLLPTRYFPLDLEKARRIRAFLDRQGQDFALMARAAFLSSRECRFRAIVRTIHLACLHGPRALDLLDDEVLSFLACQKEVRREAHRFQGLLRLRQMHDGSLLGVFAPKHDVLTLVLPHFADRFPSERLMILDETRHLAGLSAEGRVSFTHVEEFQVRTSQQEAAMQALWQVFFHHLAILERSNARLQQQHLPRYTWKNLPEMQPQGPAQPEDRPPAGLAGRPRLW